MIDELSPDTLIYENLPRYKNSKPSGDQRIGDLLNRMTLEEKVAQMLCIRRQQNAILFNEDGNLNLNNLERHFKRDIGQIARLSDTNSGLNAQEMAELANGLQKHFVEKTCLGIPAIFHNECSMSQQPKIPFITQNPLNRLPRLIHNLSKKYYRIAENPRPQGAYRTSIPMVDIAHDSHHKGFEKRSVKINAFSFKLVSRWEKFSGDGNYKDKTLNVR